jgi:hypothetical protein
LGIGAAAPGLVGVGAAPRRARAGCTSARLTRAGARHPRRRYGRPARRLGRGRPRPPGTGAGARFLARMGAAPGGACVAALAASAGRPPAARLRRPLLPGGAGHVSRRGRSRRCASPSRLVAPPRPDASAATPTPARARRFRPKRDPAAAGVASPDPSGSGARRPWPRWPGAAPSAPAALGGFAAAVPERDPAAAGGRVLPGSAIAYGGGASAARARHPGRSGLRPDRRAQPAHSAARGWVGLGPDGRARPMQASASPMARTARSSTQRPSLARGRGPRQSGHAAPPTRRHAAQWRVAPDGDDNGSPYAQTPAKRSLDADAAR